jgi:mannose-6-phosphate isomerase-like protein (cupin superfamily)
MEIFDLNNSNIYPLEERDRNVLFQTETFKVRLIQVDSGGEIPPCTMATNVLFCVLQGEGIITVNDKTNQVKPHSLLITPPATISMKSEVGMRLLGIQITTKSS